jgi:formylglycine-generating enzyme required for sulfatase activity
VRAAALALVVAAGLTGVLAADPDGMVFVPGGTFTMGSDHHQPEERFAHTVRVDGFWIDRHEVTNAQFRQFVEATGYVTLAERGLDAKARPDMPDELRAPGSVALLEPKGEDRGPTAGWWQFVAGASWRRPTGPGSSIAGKDSHPVVHVAYEDAVAYARWRGHSLPTEAQWEFAARGGRDEEDDSSSAFDAQGKPVANTWQGAFPVKNTKDDGYAGTSPVGSYPPNGYGLFDMIGNVWEWTADWYQPQHPREAATNPTGPASSRVTPDRSASRVIKGGSHLCAASYCSRYRPAARQPQEVDLSAAHLGFRTVRVAPAGVR